MPNTHSTLTSLFSDIADAIRGKTGSSATIVADNFPTAIANIPTGGSPNIQPLSVTTNGTYTAPSGVDGYSPVTVNVSGGGGSSGSVKFIDYDGTVLHTYSAAEFATLTAMPANPTHTGLTSQGWNWSLADAKTYVANCGMLDIGQMYITDDGKTRVYISLIDSARLSPYLGICPNGTVVINWGDNSATDTLTGTSLTSVKRVQHTYASTGDYVITLEVTSGSFQIYGSSTSTNGSYLLTRTGGNISSQKCYQNAIQKVELGANVSLGNYAFGYCYSLTSITLPNSIGGTINSNAFYYCFSLQSITIPSGVTSISSNAFSGCYSLASIAIANSVVAIGDAPFYNCPSLQRITIPSGVKSTGTNMAYGCFSLVSVAIPSVTNIGASSFQTCRSLTNIMISSDVTSIGSIAFNTCCSLTSITIPSGVTTISSNMLSACYSLASITIPSSVTSIGSSAFSECYSLSSITIPSGVTSIDASAFSKCYGVAEYHFLPTTPPTLANTNAFTGILADCKIYVPAESLTAYQEATNWSTYASYMVGE